MQSVLTVSVPASSSAAPPATVPTAQQSRKKAVPRPKKSVSVTEETTPAEEADESDEDLKMEVVQNISRITKETTVSVKQSTEVPVSKAEDTASEIVVSAMPKRTQSVRDRVKQAISSVSSGGMKSLKQSTLNFAKRSA